MSDLDKLKGSVKTKDYDIKTIKAKSNSLVAKSLEVLDEYMQSDVSLKDKAQMGFKILTQHITILDRVERVEFMKLNKANLVLKNNMMLQRSLSGDDSEYKKVVVEQTSASDNLDMGWDLIANGDTSQLN